MKLKAKNLIIRDGKEIKSGTVFEVSDEEGKKLVARKCATEITTQEVKTLEPLKTEPEKKEEPKKK